MEKYRNFINQYGLISLIYVLHHFERVENYEECEIIRAVIQDESCLPITLDNDTIDMVIECYEEFGQEIDKEKLLEKSQSYANEFINNQVKNL